MNAPERFARATGSTLWLFVTRVFVEPVRHGRLRDVGWPPGLRPIVAVGIVGYILAVALVVGAGFIRQEVDLFVQAGSGAAPLPRGVLWIVMALTALAVSLGQAGAMHARAWVRWVVTAFTVLVMLLSSVPDLSALPVGRATAVLFSVVLIVLVAVRSRSTFAWWEFVVVSGLMTVCFAVNIAVISAASLPFGYDFVPVMVGLILLTVGQLAVPAAIAAGAALAELAVSSAVWAAGVARDRLGRTAVIVLLCVVVLWRIWDVVPSFVAVATEPQFEVPSLISAAAFLTVIAGSWFLIERLRRRRDVPTTEGLITTLASVSLLIAACLTLIIPTSLLQLGAFVVQAYGGAAILGDAQLAFSALASSSVVVAATRALTGLALIALGLILARRGRPVLPELLVAVGVANAVVGLGNLTDLPLLWTSDALALVATILSFGLLVWMLATRRTTVVRLAAITAALLIAALFTHREFISDPLTAVPGLAAVSAVLVGLIWSLLTGYGAANETSEKYPRPTRVLLVLGNAVFVATVLAYTSLARDPESIVDLALFTEYGSQGFGDALIACSLLVAFVATVRDEKLV